MTKTKKKKNSMKKTKSIKKIKKENMKKIQYEITPPPQKKNSMTLPHTHKKHFEKQSKHVILMIKD